MPVALPLEAGGLLVDAEIAWESYGRRNPGNAIVVLHDLCESHHALGEGFAEGWGKGLIGPDRALDPQSRWVVCLNLLGSPFGSTSASLMPLSAGSKSVLHLSLADIARAATSAMRTLGICKARSIVGLGLGGMVALKAVALFPDVASSVITLGAAHALPPGLREGLGMASQQVKAGAYRKARSDLLSWTHRREHLLHWHDGEEGMQRWLSAEADEFCGRFDGRSWACLATAYADADLRDQLARIRCKALLVAGSHDDLAPPALVRETYGALEAEGARFFELSEERGHAFLLTDVERMKPHLLDFLSSI